VLAEIFGGITTIEPPGSCSASTGPSGPTLIAPNWSRNRAFLVEGPSAAVGVEHLLAVARARWMVFASRFCRTPWSADHHRIPWLRAIDRLVLKGIDAETERAAQGKAPSAEGIPAKGAGESRPRPRAWGVGADKLSMNKLLMGSGRLGRLQGPADARLWPSPRGCSTPSLPERKPWEASRRCSGRQFCGSFSPAELACIQADQPQAPCCLDLAS